MPDVSVPAIARVVREGSHYLPISSRIRQRPSSRLRRASAASNSAKSNLWLYFTGWPGLTLMSNSHSYSMSPCEGHPSCRDQGACAATLAPEPAVLFVSARFNGSVGRKYRFGGVESGGSAS